ncbi:carboxypeptidase B-like [Neocloeon triangulifer]|uniref:carboxypeptidase B-like n=1 Tax=Neocloeon triangulifer TaxID=2078957 RepID=UPI00286F6F60|nr:carboxypeptidase B-like [Neocloeon triangulifer]
MKVGVCLLLALLGSALGYNSYSGYQVLQTRVLTNEDAELLAPFMNRPEFDFVITPRVGRAAEIMASPENVVILRNNLKRLNLEPIIIVEDVGILIEKERSEIAHKRALEKKEGRAPALDRFLSFDEIEAYIDEVAAAFPNIVSVIQIGTSYEGRPLRVVKLSNGPGKNAIWFDAAIHAREWIAPPTALFAINELTENLANNQALLDANDWYFLVVANPDGYSYSWTDDRLWRKTRRPNPGGTPCVGTDPNRNFDQHWGEAGIPSPCDETFPGGAPFSESETKAISDFILATPSITFYVAIHSYGQYILYPYGHTGLLPPTVDELDRVAQEANNAITSVNGNSYDIGTTAGLLYLAFGVSNDWAYDQANIPYAYTIELPGGGLAGFNPPASLIAPTNAECWEAYKVFAANIPAARR